MEDNHVERPHFRARRVLQLNHRDQDMTRSAFMPMPSNTSVQQAVDLLNEAPANP